MSTTQELLEIHKELNELSDTAMKRYIGKHGVNWIYDWIDNLLEKEILEELTPDEKYRYKVLKARFDELTAEVYVEG